MCDCRINEEESTKKHSHWDWREMGDDSPLIFGVNCDEILYNKYLSQLKINQKGKFKLLINKIKSKFI